MQTIKSGSQTVASVADRTTAANTYNTQHLQNQLSNSNQGNKDDFNNNFDVALPKIISPNSTQQMK